MADERPDWFPGALAAQDAYQGDFPDRAPVRITVRPQMEVAPPKSFEDYLGEATQPREADTLQRPPVFGLTNRYVDPNDPSTQAGAQRLSNYYGLPGRLLAGDPRNVIAPEVPGQWSDRDEARAALQAGNMTLGGMGMGVDATTGAMPRGFAGTANTLGVGGGRPPRMGAVVEPPEPIRRMVAWRDPSGRPTRTAPLPIGTEQAILEQGYGMATGPRPPMVPQNFKKLEHNLVLNNPQYVYHATNMERASDIAAGGKLNTHRPGEFTDQSVWPDGATQKRNYFSHGNPWMFAPEEGAPTILRIKKSDHPFRRESTGDIYSTKPVPSSKIEYLDQGGTWKSLQPQPLPQPPLMQAAERKGPMGSVADLTTPQASAPITARRTTSTSSTSPRSAPARARRLTGMGCILRRMRGGAELSRHPLPIRRKRN